MSEKEAKAVKLLDKKLIKTLTVCTVIMLIAILIHDGDHIRQAYNWGYTIPLSLWALNLTVYVLPVVTLFLARSARASATLVGAIAGVFTTASFLIIHLCGSFTGNWGVSVTYFPNQVTTSIASALPWTICLVGTTTIISFFVQQALGIWAGWRRGGAFDNIISPVSTIFQAVPYFWLALIFIWVFARTLHWFPQSGGYNYREVVPGFTWEFFSSAVQYAILPALTILVSSLGMGVVGMRNMMVSTLSEDYIVTAEAKGLSPKRVMMCYAARNAVLPSISGFGTSIGAVVGGSLLTEQVFSYPGVGQMLLQAVTSNDYALMQGIFLIITVTVLVVNFIIDLLYGIIDPRTRQQD